MLTETARRQREQTGPAAPIAVLTARRAARSAVWPAAIFAVFIAVSAWGYAIAYPTLAERRDLARTFGGNLGVAAILGPADHIDTVGGFTAWRCVVVLSVVGAIWALLTATRLLRGEEDAGRWELMLAGATTRRSATAQALAGLAVAAVVLWALPALVTVWVGRSGRIAFTLTQSLWLAFAACASGAMFLALGTCIAQFSRTRRQAAGWTAGVLGVAYAVRMAADSVSGLAWLRWATPLGWVEELQPMGAARPVAAAPILALIAACSLVAVRTAGRRDLGGAALGSRTARPERTARLHSPEGLAIRLLGPATVGWTTGVALGGLLLGLIAKSAGEAVAASPGARATLARLGARGVGAQAYLGAAFLPIALLVALIAAGHVTAARTEEADGRLEQLLIRPVSRTRWLAGRVAIASSVVTGTALLAGLATWVGAASQHTGIGITRLLAAGGNVAAPAFVVLGTGVCAIGIRPRLAPVAAYGLIVWSFLVEIIGSVVHANRVLLDTSLFHHRAAAPAVDPSWTSNLALLVVAAGLILVGWFAFLRRDIIGE